MSASLTPRCLPSSPCPRKGIITPGESIEYIGCVDDNFSRVDSERVYPGNGEVRRGFLLAIIEERSTGPSISRYSPFSDYLLACIPTARSALSSVDLPIFGIPTTRTFKALDL